MSHGSRGQTFNSPHNMCGVGVREDHSVLHLARDSWRCNPIYAEAAFPNGPQLSDLPNILPCPYLK